VSDHYELMAKFERNTGAALTSAQAQALIAPVSELQRAPRAGSRGRLSLAG